MSKNNWFRLILYVELALSLISLLYFFITMITPFHYLDFFGGLIATISLFYCIRKTLYAIKAKGDYQPLSGKNYKMRYIYTHLVPIYTGLICINLADYITYEPYSYSDFLNDLYVMVAILLLGFGLEFCYWKVKS